MAPRYSKKTKLKVTDEIVTLIRGSHPQLKRKIKAALKQILSDPETGKSLRDELEGLKSFQVGRFRIIYRITSKDFIEIVAIGPRKIIYEETFRIIKREMSE
jgi:mRNA-degrading endonuclease RelE of RelBE toxin-antitoxin system